MLLAMLQKLSCCRRLLKSIGAVSYAIGVAEPMGVYVNTYGTSKINLTDGEIAEKVNQIFDLRPATIINRLKLKTLSIPKQLPMDIWEDHLKRKQLTFR